LERSVEQLRRLQNDTEAHQAAAEHNEQERCTEEAALCDLLLAYVAGLAEVRKRTPTEDESATEATHGPEINPEVEHETFAHAEELIKCFDRVAVAAPRRSEDVDRCRTELSDKRAHILASSESPPHRAIGDEGVKSRV
jgi:hypothetical protein